MRGDTGQPKRHAAKNSNANWRNFKDYSMNTLSSHVLDTTVGKPAQGIALTLTQPDGSTLSGEKDSDGRFKNWGVEDGFAAGV